MYIILEITKSIFEKSYSNSNSMMVWGKPNALTNQVI